MAWQKQTQPYNNYIYNVKPPMNNDQGANKGYVDSAITADYQKSRILI